MNRWAEGPFGGALSEKFLKLVQGMAAWNARDDMASQVGIYQNAVEKEITQDEMRRDGKYYLGAWLVPMNKTWYCWAREHLEHAAAKSAIGSGVPSIGAVPVYVWYDVGRQSAEVAISSFSAGEESVSEKDIEPAIAAIPSFRKLFKTYTIRQGSY